eukprot:768603-Hanusia_phi.AAC.5
MTVLELSQQRSKNITSKASETAILSPGAVIPGRPGDLNLFDSCGMNLGPQLRQCPRDLSGLTNGPGSRFNTVATVILSGHRPESDPGRRHGAAVSSPQPGAEALKPCQSPGPGVTESGPARHVERYAAKVPPFKRRSKVFGADYYGRYIPLRTL